MTDALAAAELVELADWQRKVADALGVSDGPDEFGPWRCADAESAADLARWRRAQRSEMEESDAEFIALVLAEARLRRTYDANYGEVDSDTWEHAQEWTDIHEALEAAICLRLDEQESVDIHDTLIEIIANEDRP